MVARKNGGLIGIVPMCAMLLVLVRPHRGASCGSRGHSNRLSLVPPPQLAWQIRQRRVIPALKRWATFNRPYGAGCSGIRFRWIGRK
jgi:hypothetical protein